MPARTSEDVHSLWGEYFNALDLDRLVAFYEDDAAFMLQPSQFAHGCPAIREALAGFLAQEAKF